MRLRPADLPVLRVLAVMLVAALLAGCAAAGASPAPVSAEPSAAVPGGPVTSPEQAAALALAQDPRFAGIGPKDPDAIGGCCFYEVTEQPDGYLVTIEVGWGDCMAGCIDKHRWTYAVGRSGEIRGVDESGSEIPPGGIPPG